MTDGEDIEFKNSYIVIFSSNYLFQGINQSIFTVIVPIYLIIMISTSGATITASNIAFLATIGMIPWASKLLFGILSDKFGLKRVGRRKPWIIPPIIIAGVIWIAIPSMITPENAIILFIITAIIIQSGVAMADTALDGLILDICPKEQLGRTQGLCWSFRSIGMVAGGPLLVYLMITLNISVESLFILLGFLMICTSFLILLIKEAKEFPEVKIWEKLKIMFRKKRDWKVYLYALFNATIDGIAILFIALYLLIQMDIIAAEGASLELLEGGTDMEIYIYQANIALIISIGIIIGAVVGGIIVDKISRRYGVFLSLLITTGSLLLMILQLEWTILLFFASLIGVGLGFRHASYSAVIGEIAKDYPEMDSTYFSICNSFFNAGTVLGLGITGIIFEATGSYIFIFIFIAIINNLGLIFFLMLNPKEYEFKLVKTE